MIFFSYFNFSYGQVVVLKMPPDKSYAEFLSGSHYFKYNFEKCEKSENLKPEFNSIFFYSLFL